MFRPKIHLILLALLAVLVACAPGPEEPGLPVSRVVNSPEPVIEAGQSTLIPPLTVTPPPGYPPPPTPTVAPLPSIFPTAIVLTPPPTATYFPVPTPIPTPLVTLIPTVVPPLTAEPPQPFWIYYWRDNEVWRVDDQGQDAELLIDTLDQLGQWLTAIPEPIADTDCCIIGPRVVVSPDGQKLALVVVDEIAPAADESFTFSIYIFDINSRELQPVGAGSMPVWSPDGQQLAFLQEGSLSVANLQTGQVRELVAQEEQEGFLLAEFAWTPDGDHIVYVYNQSNYRIPVIWMVNTEGTPNPQELLTLESSVYQLTPSLDGQQIFFLSAEGSLDSSEYHLAQNLWSVSLLTGIALPLTQGMVLDNYTISPDGERFAFGGYSLYEPGQEGYTRDLWLLNLGDQMLSRMTTAYGSIAPVDWSPNGSRLVARDLESEELLLFSLPDLSMTVSDIDLRDAHFAVGGVK